MAESSEETIVAIDDWLARGDDETIHWEGRPRVQTVIPAAVIGFTVIVITAVAAIASGVSKLAAVDLTDPFLLTWLYLRITSTCYVVTDRVLYRKTGVLSRTVQRVSFNRVQNSALSQDVTGPWFDYGTISVEVADGGAVRFEDVDDSGTLRDRVEGHDDRDELPNTVKQWVAVRDKMRTLRATVGR